MNLPEPLLPMPEGLSVVLASASPRRRELLGLILPSFRVEVPSSETSPRPEESPAQYALRAAQGKCREVFQRKQDCLVIGADTVVVVEGTILGKPVDPGDAERMLGLLSGREHQVITGLWVCSLLGEKGLFEVSTVRFGRLGAEEIRRYVASGEPMDKAGAYGIQGMAACFVEEVRGSYTNVVGLPVRRLYLVLKELFALLE